LLNVLGNFTAGSGHSFLYAFDFQGTGYYDGITPTTYTLITFNTNVGFTASDFAYLNLNSAYSGVFNLTGNSLQLTVVPEPAAWSIVASGLALLLGLRRKRANKSAAVVEVTPTEKA
jgi:hypothetical protein